VARYGTFLYGAAKYGATTNPNLLWGVEVDWDGDGLFSGASEATRVRELHVSRGRDSLFSNSGDGVAQFNRMGVGECRLTLDNHDRRFDPWYATSPLYPNVEPGKDVRIRVKNGNTGSTYHIFRGRIDDIQCDRHHSDPSAALVVSDGWRLLLDRNSTVALRTDTSVDVLADDVLDDVGWPSTWGQSLDAGSDVIPYGWIESQSGFDALHDLVESEMGFLYVGADGKIYLISRHNLITAASALTLDQANVGNEPQVGNPWDFVRNKISVRAFPRALAALGEIWRLDEVPSFAPGQSRTIWATFRDSNYNSTIAQDVATPVATTDYTMNTAADGSGTNLTASFTVTISIFAGSAKLVVTNGASVDGYITLLKIRGKALELLNVSANISESSVSQASYGKRQLSLELPFLQQTAVAEDMSDWLLSWLKSPLPQIVVEMVAQPTIQFAYDLGTVLTFTSAYLGINKRFRIGKIEHDSLESMQAIRTRWTLEPMDQQTQYWVLGVAGFGELGTTTRLAY
jgi:hypothetical protein